ncbi:MAG TPA: hypothetical protein VGP85_07360 [Pyrinomonadaceae bacterium]|jgi:hypothetical protein|nr:hypothetical protein [Pyrinomonadaceae bacterium]
MNKSKILTFALAVLVFLALGPLPEQSRSVNAKGNLSFPAAEHTTSAMPINVPDQNKFAGRWTSRLTLSSGQVIDDGLLDISDTAEANEVAVVHSVRGGPVTGHTMAYPDRIEIQISLGDGRVAHYNGVLVSVNRIEGRFFVTGSPESHHSRSHLIVGEETWAATAT